MKPVMSTVVETTESAFPPTEPIDMSVLLLDEDPA
jgi:hypothetical protein